MLIIEEKEYYDGKSTIMRRKIRKDENVENNFLPNQRNNVLTAKNFSVQVGISR